MKHLLLAVLSVLSFGAAAQHHTVVPADDIKWGAAPASLPPGAQAAALLGAPGMPHYLVAEVETIVQINGTGPFDVVYINPLDDPRKQ